MAKAASANQGDVFDVERIRDLIDLMEERGLCEVDLKQAEQQIRLVRGTVSAAPAAPVAAAAAAPAAPAPAAEAPVESASIVTINAPMVGTFYNRPNPKSPEFVKVGSRVSADTVVCIVEAMKVFNEIPAEISGVITEVLASNEEAVDFGKPLFKVDTSA